MRESLTIKFEELRVEGRRNRLIVGIVLCARNDINDHMADSGAVCAHVCFQIGVCESIFNRDTLFRVKRLREQQREICVKRR